MSIANHRIARDVPGFDAQPHILEDLLRDLSKAEARDERDERSINPVLTVSSWWKTIGAT